VLILGGAVLLLFALLSITGSKSGASKKRVENTLLGALAVGAMVFALLRAGLPWLAVGLAVLWTAAKRFGARADTDAAPPRSAGGSARARGSSPPTAMSRRMTREEALDVLGLGADATADQILAEYRRLMKKVHPDQGGTTYLATRLNEAKDVLLGG
jgi:DnaJ homolog subfamily C member 19